MNDLDIDETLPGQEIEEDVEDEVIRREADISSPVRSSSSSFNNSFTEAEKEESLRGWLYLVAGAGYGTLIVYLVLVINDVIDVPFLSSDSDNSSGALYTAVLISAMVYVTIWFFMSGKNHSFFTDDPDKAKFYAGIIGLASLVIIAISWEDHQREMIISAILTAVSTWSYIRSSEMKA